MKKIIMIMAMSLSLFVIQSCGGDDKKDKDKDDKELSAGNVPDAVKAAFSAKYATASDVTWEDAHENDKQSYKAKFKLDGKKMKAEFDTAGTLIKEGEDE